jgi:hypothetical protein
MKVCFFDIDGVLRIAQNPDGTNEQFVTQLVRNLARVVEVTGAKLVISSDWRRRKETLEIMALMPSLPLDALHGDQLPYSVRDRGVAIRMWIDRHPMVTGYAIIDDCARLFDEAPPFVKEHLVLCNGRIGFVADRVGAVLQLLEDRTEHQQTQFTGGDATNDADL